MCCRLKLAGNTVLKLVLTNFTAASIDTEADSCSLRRIHAAETGRIPVNRLDPPAISRTLLRSMLLATLWLSVTPVASLGQIISNGNFDDLTVGSAPDNGVPAGSWSIPTFGPPHADEIEDSQNQFTIVETSTFAPGSAGNSMRIESPGNHTTTFVENIFSERIRQSPDEILRASFDVFVPSQDGMLGGLAVHLADGSSNRGPLMGWDSQGRINVHQTSVTYLVNETPLDTWQHVQLDIDLMDDSYDFFWSADDEPLELIAPYVSFTSFSGGVRSSLDRFALALYPDMPSRPEGVAYVDNIVIEVLAKTPGDANFDGEVDFSDFLSLSKHFGEGTRRDPRGWSQGDFDGDGAVDFPDFLILSESFGTVANASAASVPEPTGLSIALFGLLGLIGFRKRR